MGGVALTGGASIHRDWCSNHATQCPLRCDEMPYRGLQEDVGKPNMLSPKEKGVREWNEARETIYPHSSVTNPDAPT